ncbi:hypothetical protein M3936_08695 [Sutcliffiella horikoshii]|uniref:hypothetical protein n=1 Tax=Sutcliffiella horikoshii TaxID=79883 RepID=UPI00203B7C65|nr:hypothetical protein [Sutcliffiella horikoshii]MCM3617657.1 hypothetical protein [Sutcliffiella horikoshii]
MVASLIILGIILMILGILTPIGSGTTILISVILFVMAIVLSFKKRRVSNT